jgi:hypothetical protein
MTKEVLHFIVVPPFSKRSAVAAVKDRVENYLSRQFPGYEFTVGPFAPVGNDDAFCILPVMNFAGPDGKSYMCDPPRRWFIQEIAEACASFNFKPH